jgi:hypothetical protein
MPELKDGKRYEILEGDPLAGESPLRPKAQAPAPRERWIPEYWIVAPIANTLDLLVLGERDYALDGV